MLNYAYVFPGQGSQSVGMLHELADNYAIVHTIFDRVSTKLGEDIWALVQNGPIEVLNQTEYTQVAMLTADVAAYVVLQQLGVPDAKVMAGHSLGEYAALVCAGALSLEDAAILVRTRGRLMQQTVPDAQGAMAAIVGLTDAQVQSICVAASDTTMQVTPANYNAIGQVVIAGHTSAVNHAITLALSMQARLAKIIPVSVPCHCDLLKPAASLFAEQLALVQFSVPRLPVISNVDLSYYNDVVNIRRLLVEQLYSPVRWVETILHMQKSGINCVIECGPGAVLSGLIKRIDKSITTLNLEKALIEFSYSE